MKLGAIARVELNYCIPVKVRLIARVELNYCIPVKVILVHSDSACSPV